jgi:RNA polymerase sigma-32 factor
MARKPRKSPRPRGAKKSTGATRLARSDAPAPTGDPIEADVVAHDRALPVPADESPGGLVPDEIENQPLLTEASGAGFDAATEGGELPLPGIEDIEGAGSSSASEGGSLVPFNPLSRYLSEIRRFPLLSREEELEVAKRYLRYHDREDAYRLVTANLRLVVKIANEFARASKNLLDLVQEGNVGLMEAVKNFDPYRGIRFPSYAVWWVRAYIYRYLINNWRLVKIGTTQAQRKLFFNLRKESERLEAEGFTPQPKLLAQRMGVKESEVREMQERMAQSEISLDQPTAPGEDTRLLDALPDSGLNPEETAARAEWSNFAHEKVEQFVATLKDKELEIFRERLLSENPPTLQEVGSRFGISRERVRQIESRLKRRLKDFLKEQAGDIGRAET